MLHALADDLGDDELVVYYNSVKGPPLFEENVNERFVRLPTATAWNQIRLPVAIARDRCDVYLGGALVVPAVAKAPRVVVIHDCMPFRFPESKSRRSGAYLRRWMKSSARRSALVVTDSTWAAQECQEFLGVGPDRIRVIPAAADPSFAPAAEGSTVVDEMRTRFGLVGPYVLQVGAFELHKGGGTAVDAVEMLRRRGHDVTLVRCGIAGGDESRPGRRDLGYVDDADLRALYQGAAVVCVSSTHEGFGLPVLEAMASGVPVVAARASALPEVGGDVALYAEPGDADGFANAIERLLVDCHEAASRRQLGVARAATFTWARTASQMHDVLAEVAAR
jgi:glycosyltransferase involved in cell wall biosynthesis